MRSVNNKYLIEYEMSIEKNLSNYIVIDSEKNKKYVICILKNDFTYEKTREYLLSKFKTIRNLNFENVVNVINIEIIYSINGIKLDKPQYGYLMEYVESKIDPQTYIKECNPYKKLDIFMELCSAINTLNMQGYVFEDISIKDIILIPNSKNKVKVKIKNLLQNEICKFNLLNSLPYDYNIETREDVIKNKDNLEQVIKLFNQIFTEDELQNQLKKLNYVKKIYSRIQNLTKFYNLKKFIQDINSKTENKYKAFVGISLNKLENDLDTIGMQEEIKIVEKNFQKILESKETNKIIAFSGEYGCGKSRLLQEIKYRIENKYFKKVMYISDFKDEKISKEEEYYNLLYSIYENLDKNLKDKYEIYLKKFISILIEKESMNNETKQKLQLMNRIGNLLKEYTLTTPFVIVIDDLDKGNEFLKLFVRYISFLGNNIENIMIIFSINENRCDEKFLAFMQQIRDLNQYEEYKINNFNQYNTTKIIKKMLNTNQDINKLAVKIYSETLGNPQYIISVIKELYENDTLYFSQECGQWITNIKIKDILIPKNLEKRLQATITSLNENEINVLRKLSIFETPLSEKIILKYIIVELENVEIYTGLKSKGFLVDKISDQGILVGFTNNLLRNILYLNLNQEDKIKMHHKASIFFEEILFETDYYIEEFLIHLERGNNVEKAYFYILKYAKTQDLLGDATKSIFYYKKALKYPINLTKSEVAINIAKLYQKKSNHEKSYEYFEKANEFAVENDQLDLIIYTLLEMIIIKIFDITDMDTGICYSLNSIRRLLDMNFYPKGEIYYYYALSLKYRLEYNHRLTLINSKRALIICKDNNIKEDVYGWVINILVEEYTKEENYDEAKKLCLYAIEIFEYNNNIDGELSSKLLYASICKENGDNNDVILDEYLEIARLSNKYKVYRKEILSLIYIAKIHNQEKKYDEAEKYLLRALERQREEGIDSKSFNIYNELCLLYIRSRKIKLAIEYYYLINQMKNGIKLLEEEAINSNYTYALYNLLICNYDFSYYYLKKIYVLLFNTKNSYYKTLICNYYELMLYKCKNKDDIKNVYKKLNNKIVKLQDTDMELEIKISAIRRILLLGYYNYAKELFLNLNGYPKDYNLEAAYVFLELNFKNKSYYNFLINKALRLCAFSNNQEIKADIYDMVGEKYIELECYDIAMNYFYESISMNMDIINLLPQNDSFSYANNSRFLKTRNKFIKCINSDLNINIKFKEIEFIKTNEELNEVLNELSLTNILRNELIFKLMQEFYDKCYYNDMSNIYKVFDKFSTDTGNNIKNVMIYMARLTLSDKAMIVTENNQGENEVICTYRISNKNDMNRYFSLKVDSEEDVFVICKNDARFYGLDDEILKDEIKACMYMKLTNREKHINIGAGTNARLILITNNAVNNINDESKKLIETFKPFLTFLLEKYYLTISSTIDKLTGVYNRKYFEEALLSLLDSVRKENAEFAVIMFDIDDFKGVNDKYGHQTGDETLSKLTREVKKCVGKRDIIGRYGGEEFILLLPHVNKEKAINIAEKIRKNVEDARILGDKRAVTISIGIVMSAYESLTSEEIVKRADQALYKAKYEGKNKCILWKKDYGISINTNNDLTGIISGNATKDYNLALIIKDVANIVKYVGDKEEKIYKFVLKVMQAIECETATIFIVKNNEIINIYSKQRFKDGWNVIEKYNFKLIYNIIEEKKGLYLIDWDSMDNYNQHGIPDWKSNCIAPIICNGEVLAIIYLSVSINKKEFTCNDYNILNCFAEIGLPIFF